MGKRAGKWYPMISWYPTTAIMVSATVLNIRHGNHDASPRQLWYPITGNHRHNGISPLYRISATAITMPPHGNCCIPPQAPTDIMVSPTVLNIRHGNYDVTPPYWISATVLQDASPRQSWYPSTVLNIRHCTAHTLSGVWTKEYLSKPWDYSLTRFFHIRNLWSEFPQRMSFSVPWRTATLLASSRCEFLKIHSFFIRTIL